MKTAIAQGREVAMPHKAFNKQFPVADILEKAVIEAAHVTGETNADKILQGWLKNSKGHGEFREIVYDTVKKAFVGIDAGFGEAGAGMEKLLSDGFFKSRELGKGLRAFRPTEKLGSLLKETFKL